MPYRGIDEYGRPEFSTEESLYDQFDERTDDLPDSEPYWDEEDQPSDLTQDAGGHEDSDYHNPIWDPYDCF